MPLVPNLLERAALLRANQGPGPILDLFGAVGLKAVLAAHRAGMLDELSSAAATAPQVAERCELDPRGVAALLGVLEPLGYVRRRGDVFELTAMTRKWLSSGGDVPFVDFLRWWDEGVLPHWDSQLDEALATGRPSTGLYDSLDSEGWGMAQAGFEAVARMVAPTVAAKLPLPGRSGHLLDLGGGHGLYSIDVCLRFAGWSATVVDNELALAAARENIESAALADRVSVRTGDALAGDIGDGYNAALLFNLIHGFDTDQIGRVFQRVHEALVPGGVIVILEQFDDWAPGRVGRLGTRLLDFAYLVGMSGRVHSVDVVGSLLAEAGFGGVKRTRLLRAPGNSLLSATRA